MFDGDATRVEPSPLDTDEIPIPAGRLRPPRVWGTTWGLGALATVLCLVQALSGLVLMRRGGEIRAWPGPERARRRRSADERDDGERRPGKPGAQPAAE